MKPVLIVSAILGILGIPAGAYFVFSDRQIEVEYGTKTVCYKCKTVEKAPDKKIVWASKRHDYEVEVKESCCDKCKIEVETGTIITCTKCGREISRDVRDIKVDPREREQYALARRTETCDACQTKAVVWGFSNYYVKWRKFCPHCGNSLRIELQFTTCGNCGKQYRHVPGSCGNCNGRGTWTCPKCKGSNTDVHTCLNCSGKGYFGRIECSTCKGSGKATWDKCFATVEGKYLTIGCKDGKMYCRACDGRGTIN